MPYLITDIATASPGSGLTYLFDCNVWLAVIEDSYGTAQYRQYIRFFNAILENKNNENATIALPSILVSEILNRLVRDIYYKEFAAANPTLMTGQFSDFKKVYRPNAQYAIDVERACGSIRAYHRRAKFISDNLDQFAFREIIKNIPQHLDFNDHLFSKIASTQGLIVVTNDSDFAVEDIHVITAQQSLLALA